MKYPTKQKRLLAIADAYMAVFRKSQFTTSEVADWAIRKGLYPVPRRGDRVEECEVWEKRLEAARL